MQEPITRRQFLNKQFLAPLALIAMLFDEKKEEENTFELDKLPLADKKLFQQLAG